ncbi:5-carboxymethyl-2-hydroxymuconate isomerase [Paenirhodobacter populi]|uniref:5-carboxymethyl-2-hydroxymuconate isomerase n=1 Tax=Paenirhodobacter populi TaxID=2306993 RepID=A0A443IST7_9RHOB|nr:5-carboxymethyl-2-hydroxymuconate isomerase [Sinirhodobacter populi]RWR10997.1 5-carboxymethyl-2-hydroxymuconate isomerase [Sinirhodobacter populi]
MPHCIVEYSSNLESSGRIGELLEKIAAHFRTAPDVFPTGGVRVRAWPVSQYVIADGNPEHAYVNITCRIGAGRPAEVRKAFFSEAYEIVVAHFREESARRGLGITFYVDQADPEGSWKTNSIHQHMNKG